MTITYSDFLGAIAENEGKKLRTIGDNADFFASKSPTGVRLVIGQGTSPVINAAKIQEYLEIFNVKQSFLTPDYNANLRHSVYVLGIIKLWLDRQQAESLLTEDEMLDAEAEGEYSSPEGRRLLRTHLRRERDPQLVKQAKKSFFAKHKRLFCEVCLFDFGPVYGEPDFIEAHHRIPLRDCPPGHRTKISDLAMVCANCHRMLHRGNPWPTVEELKERPGVRALARR